MVALRLESMSSAALDELELLTKADAVKETYKSTSPSLTRCFRLLDSKEEAMDQVLATARKHGWPLPSHPCPVRRLASP